MKRRIIKPGEKVDLREWGADDGIAKAHGKDQGEAELAASTQRIEELQELLFAERKHRLLIVLQGMDTSGKDGAIKHVFRSVNPQGVRVASFKKPNELELDHDYLWRVHHQVPGRGEIAIFNRSHYEDVLVVRVHDQISTKECEHRYRQINDFERMLVEEGATLLKFFLHISKDEQKKRLEARLSDPRKHWKFDYTDVRERKLWHEYQRAYQELLRHTSTKRAPWHVVPANHKWVRNVYIARVIVDTLEALDMKYPKSRIDASKVRL